MNFSILTRLSVVASMALTLAACGSAKPLTETQKQSVKETADSFAHTAGLLPLETTGTIHPIALSISRGETAGTGAAAAQPSELEKEFKEKVRNECETESLAHGYQLKGTQCPITLIVTMEDLGSDANDSETQALASIKQHHEFKLNDARYAPVLDVDAFKFDMDYKYEASVRGAGSTSVDAKFTSKGKFTGDFHSQKAGTVKYLTNTDVSLQGSSRGATVGSGGGSGKTTHRYEFKDFVAEAVQEFNRGSGSELKINGKKTTQSEFNSFFGKGPLSLSGGYFFGMGFGGGATITPAGDSN